MIVIKKNLEKKCSYAGQLVTDGNVTEDRVQGSTGCQVHAQIPLIRDGPQVKFRYARTNDIFLKIPDQKRQWYPDLH